MPRTALIAYGKTQTGAIAVGTLIGVALLALFAYLLLGAAEGDTAHYGRVPVPSTTSIELPEGETDVYYAEAVDPSAGVSLTVPEDLEYTITDAAGQAVSVASRGGDPEESDGGTARLIGAVDAPADGTYTVTVTSDTAAQRGSAQLTFGQSPFGAVRERFEGVVDALRGPAGVAVAALLVVLFLLPRFQRALARRSQG